MIQGIDHIELIVRQLDEYVAFLKTLGFETVRETSHHGGSVEMKPPGEGQPVFEIHQVTGEEVIGVNHIAFKVASAQEAYDDIREKGITPEREPHLVEVTGRTNVNLRDPDGWRLQLVDAARKVPQ